MTTEFKLVPADLLESLLDDPALVVRMSSDKIVAIKEALYSPAQPQSIFDEAKERQMFEDSMIEASEEAGFGEPDLYRDSAGCYRQEYHQAAWGGWLACAQSRAKAREVGHE